jgi:pimeloyl-ACP methyl ester carboxylesterase
MVAQINAPTGLEINPKGPNPDIDQELRGEIILEMAANLGIRDEDVRCELDDDLVQKGPQNWAWVQATLRAMDRLPGINSHFIDLVTRDVYVYMQALGVRMAIDGIVRDAIGAEPSVVVAHSLGTVITYNVLQQRAEAPPVARLVTLGSPLGIGGLKRKLDKPLRHPPCVGSWFNAYDRRDVVSLVPLDASNFDIVPAIENKGDVNNFTDNRHGIEGYLADAVVARRIVDALA